MKQEVRMILRGGTLTGFAYEESLEEVRDSFGGGTSGVWKEVRVSAVNVPPRFRQRPAVPEDQARGEGDHDSACPGAVQIRSCGGGAGEPAFSPPGLLYYKVWESLPDYSYQYAMSTCQGLATKDYVVQAPWFKQQRARQHHKCFCIRMCFA